MVGKIESGRQGWDKDVIAFLDNWARWRYDQDLEENQKMYKLVISDESSILQQNISLLDSISTV